MIYISLKSYLFWNYHLPFFNNFSFLLNSCTFLSALGYYSFPFLNRPTCRIMYLWALTLVNGKFFPFHFWPFKGDHLSLLLVLPGHMSPAWSFCSHFTRLSLPRDFNGWGALKAVPGLLCMASGTEWSGGITTPGSASFTSSYLPLTNDLSALH